MEAQRQQTSAQDPLKDLLRRTCVARGMSVVCRTVVLLGCHKGRVAMAQRLLAGRTVGSDRVYAVDGRASSRSKLTACAANHEPVEESLGLVPSLAAPRSEEDTGAAAVATLCQDPQAATR